MPNDGKNFERRIENLLALKSTSNLTREKHFGTKKIDLYFEQTQYGKKKKYGVECKDLSSPLTQKNIRDIKIDYEAALANRDITDLLIVSNCPLSAQMQTYVDSLDYVFHQTESDLRNEVIDFRNYLSGTRARFEDKMVHRYYIEPQGRIIGSDGVIEATTPTLIHSDLISYIIDQMDNLNGPLIVLGSYGIGKTTLAEQIFLRLLRRWDEQPGEPIPIYISLEQMQREQSIQGLLGTLFTASSSTPGYNFDIFNKMNRDGHFTIIMDGVDEMRQSVNSREFKLNIDEITTLTKDNPRSIMFGRPSAFMDEGEYDYVLRGRRNYLDEPARAPTGFRELHIAVMTDNQVTNFVEKFCPYYYEDGSVVPRDIYELIWDQSNEILSDIARRPIQLRMMIEIYPLLNKGVTPSIATIYSLFLSDLISREVTKRRHGPSEFNRRAFARLVAVWLWRHGRKVRFDATQIPPEIIEGFCETGDNLDAVRREYVSASFLSTEQGSHLHFPHRSIQEYCVAEFIREAIKREGGVAATAPWLGDEFDDVVTPEIADFLFALIADEKADVAIQQVGLLLDYLDGLQQIPANMSSMMRASPVLANAVKHRFEWFGGAVAGWLCVQHEFENGKASSNATRDGSVDKLLATWIKRSFEKYGDKAYADQDPCGEVFNLLLAQFILTLNTGTAKRQDLAPIAHSLALLLRMGETRTVNISGSTARPVLRQKFFPERRSFQFLSRLSSAWYGERVDIGWAYKWLRQEGAAFPFPNSWLRGETIQIPEVKLRREMELGMANFGGLRSIIEEFRERYPDPQGVNEFA